ncbi:MAG: pyruvate dehydrogenase (acetyl-transferring), homodimeric type [Chloroflexi bacterium]|nr:pyruvate dehydrogenase (acetyl-transferring), homodimeric type [Chloroflexota bacterium]
MSTDASARRAESQLEASNAEGWIETQEWVDSLREVVRTTGPERASRLLRALQIEAQRYGVPLPVTSTTPYVNTVPVEHQARFPGDRDLERRIKSIIRWNAMAMVVESNQKSHGIGGHISTYASAATLLEIGFNHFWRGPEHDDGPDLIYFQGHASPGVYARAYLEGRLTPRQLHNFRREFAEDGGLSSYPHPWLMPEFWQFPTVSMGLSPIMSIYQARFMRYLENRGLKPATDQKVWTFLGDGETDEPESLGAISLASREKLDNLIWVVNCNLQRLDGPVRGNGQIVQELEAVFRGVGWNVIKVLWGSEWDELLARDDEGLLSRRMGEVVDGEYQKYSVAGGEYIRKNFWGVDPRLERMVSHLSDDQLWRMRLGGHDPAKVYAAYKAAMEHRGGPTVILARTIKGYGLGEAGEGKNITHQQKSLNESELLQFRDRFDIPLSDEEVVGAPLYRPAATSPEAQYLHERRRVLGGYLPQRIARRSPLRAPAEELFAEFAEGSGDREASTTMVFVRMLAAMLRDDALGKAVVPIIPDEGRTFGMEALFRSAGIYSSTGQLYEPVDAGSLLFYKESRDGQILEEGITEAGSISSFIAAGTALANYGVATIPFFIFYSMFGMQRVADLVWAAADSRCRGFLVGATSGRTTLNGEGLQHQDGHSHLFSSVVPNLISYEPAYAYEIAVLIREGIRRMHDENEDVFYYLTVHNENYVHPPKPADGDVTVNEGIIRGMYRFRAAAALTADATGKPRAQLLASGVLVNEALRAQELLANDYGVAADVWSVTSWTEVRREALEVERWNRLHPGEAARTPYVAQCLGEQPGVVVGVSDYMKTLPDAIAKWTSAPVVSLGTDGFGRSATREELRRFFEVDAEHIVVATLSALVRDEQIAASVARDAIARFEIDPDAPSPAYQ